MRLREIKEASSYKLLEAALEWEARWSQGIASLSL